MASSINDTPYTPKFVFTILGNTKTNRNRFRNYNDTNMAMPFAVHQWRKVYEKIQLSIWQQMVKSSKTKQKHRQK